VNCVLIHVAEVKIEGRIGRTRRRGRRRKQQLDDLRKEKIVEWERGSTGSLSVGKCHWKTSSAIVE
jgi:hypothetical protein